MQNFFVTCEWSPWRGFHPEPALPRPCKSAPTSLGRHSCSSSSPSHRRACIPSPCRGSGHLGMQRRAAQWGKNKTKNSKKRSSRQKSLWNKGAISENVPVFSHRAIPVPPMSCLQKPWCLSLPKRKQSPTSWSSQTCSTASLHIPCLWLCVSPEKDKEMPNKLGCSKHSELVLFYERHKGRNKCALLTSCTSPNAPLPITLTTS